MAGGCHGYRTNSLVLRLWELLILTPKCDSGRMNVGQAGMVGTRCRHLLAWLHMASFQIPTEKNGIDGVCLSEDTVGTAACHI